MIVIFDKFGHLFGKEMKKVLTYSRDFLWNLC